MARTDTIIFKIADETEDSFERLIQSLETATKTIERFIEVANKFLPEQECWPGYVDTVANGTTPVLREALDGTQNER